MGWYAFALLVLASILGYAADFCIHDKWQKFTYQCNSCEKISAVTQLRVLDAAIAASSG